MPIIELTDKELNVLQGILKRAEGGSEKPARKSNQKKLTVADRLKRKYG
jgi:hypothetical protein